MMQEIKIPYVYTKEFIYGINEYINLIDNVTNILKIQNESKTVTNAEIIKYINDNIQKLVLDDIEFWCGLDRDKLYLDEDVAGDFWRYHRQFIVEIFKVLYGEEELSNNIDKILEEFNNITDNEINRIVDVIYNHITDYLNNNFNSYKSDYLSCLFCQTNLMFIQFGISINVKITSIQKLREASSQNKVFNTSQSALKVLHGYKLKNVTFDLYQYYNEKHIFYKDAIKTQVTLLLDKAFEDWKLKMKKMLNIEK